MPICSSCRSWSPDDSAHCHNCARPFASPREPRQPSQADRPSPRTSERPVQPSPVVPPEHRSLAAAFWGYFVLGGAVLGVIASRVVEYAVAPWPVIALGVYGWYVLWAAHTVWSAASRKTDSALAGLAKGWVVLVTTINLLVLAFGAVALINEQDSATYAPTPTFSETTTTGGAASAQITSADNGWRTAVYAYIDDNPDFFKGRNTVVFMDVLEEHLSAVGTVDHGTLLSRIMQEAQSRLRKEERRASEPAVPPKSRSQTRRPKVHAYQSEVFTEPAPKNCPQGSDKIGSQCCTRASWIRNEGGSETMVPGVCS